jgi:hypothetical protein
MREKIGMVCHVGGLLLMPLALFEGMRDGGSLSNELLIAAIAILLIFVGRGLRGGPAAK